MLFIAFRSLHLCLMLLFASLTAGVLVLAGILWVLLGGVYHCRHHRVRKCGMAGRQALQ